MAEPVGQHLFDPIASGSARLSNMDLHGGPASGGMVIQ